MLTNHSLPFLIRYGWVNNRNGQVNMALCCDKYPFELWKYSGKIPSINKKGQLIEDNDLDMYVSLSNNCTESINAFLKSLIPFNQSVGTYEFEKILTNLLIRMDLRVRRKFNEKVDFFPSITIKTKMRDVLYDVIKCYNNKPKIITEKQYKK